MNSYKVLKEKYIFFIPPLILISLCFLALIFLSFFIKDRFSISAIKISNLEKRLKEEKEANISLKRELVQWEEVKNGVSEFSKKLGTSSEKLTEIIKEIEELSLKSGVVPHSYGFNYGEKERKHFISFVINFPFEADYSSVRNFLHLIELTPTFIILNSINLSTAGEMSEKVRLQFQLTTFFSQEGS